MVQFYFKHQIHHVDAINSYHWEQTFLKIVSIFSKSSSKWTRIFRTGIKANIWNLAAFTYVLLFWDEEKSKQEQQQREKEMEGQRQTEQEMEQPAKAKVLAETGAQGTSSDAYEYLGNGWCKNKDNNRIKVRKMHWHIKPGTPSIKAHLVLPLF